MKNTTTHKTASGSHNTHARLSPSSSSRWLSCTASVAEIERAAREGRIPDPNSDSSVASEQGTIAHDVAEYRLTGNTGFPRGARTAFDKVLRRARDENRMRGTCGSLEEIEGHLQGYYDDVAHYTEGMITFVELEAPLFYSDGSGTADMVGVRHDDKNRISHLTVVDLKFGMGPVSAVENTQLAAYARSAAEYLVTSCIADGIAPDASVTMAISQPRVDALDPRPWKMSWDGLLEFTQQHVDSADRISRGDVRFSPSKEACKWCPLSRSKQCPAINDFVMEIRPGSSFSDEEKAKLILFAPALEAMAKDFASEFTERISEGEVIEAGGETWELRRSRGGHRRPADDDAFYGFAQRAIAAGLDITEAEASTMLYAEPKRLSLPQVEKVLKGEKLMTKEVQEEFDSLGTQTKGALYAAPSTSRGKRVNPPGIVLEESFLKLD
jgi:hypothetical protein